MSPSPHPDTQPLTTLVAEFSPEQPVTQGLWFGKPCLKVGVKVFAALWGGDMAFKLTGEAHAAALAVPGAQLFDPRAKGQPLKEWVLVPAAQSPTWGRLARLACASVAGAAQAVKTGLISGLQQARRLLLDEINLLTPQQQDEVFLGTWSSKDLLAHLVGWDTTNLQAVAEIIAGYRPGFFAFYDRDWKSYNARLVAEYKLDDYAQLVHRVEQSHRKLIDFLEALPAETYLNKKRIATLLRAETKDERVHHKQVEAFRR